MERAILLPLTAVVIGAFVLLSGCTTEFWQGVEENRRLWNAYVNSPAYYQTLSTADYRDGMGGVIHCATRCDDRGYGCETQCYRY